MTWRPVLLVMALAVGVVCACSSEDCNDGEQGEMDCSEWAA